MKPSKQQLDAALKSIHILYKIKISWPASNGTFEAQRGSLNPIPAGEKQSLGSPRALNSKNSKQPNGLWGRPRPRLNILGHFSMLIDFAQTLPNKDQLCIHAFYPELSEDAWVLQAYRSGLFPRHKTSLEQSLKMTKQYISSRQRELLIQFAQYPPFKNLPEDQKFIR